MMEVIVLDNGMLCSKIAIQATGICIPLIVDGMGSFVVLEQSAVRIKAKGGISGKCATAIFEIILFHKGISGHPDDQTIAINILKSVPPD